MPTPKSVEAPSRVSAEPTKRFFVEMLTRDIDLRDAILDLLDNCIDGVVRAKSFNRTDKRPYDKYWAKITLDGDRFSIADNCGGISRVLAEKSAFMLGRPIDYEEAAEGPTVGVYGIGMKRAIFKMGRHAEVTSQTDREAFRVTIPESWFSETGNWFFPLTPLQNPLKHTGTTIVVRRLEPSIERQFADTDTFCDGLTRVISEAYSLIIERGFTVQVNRVEVRPVPLILHSVDLNGYKKGIAPYLFKGNINGVDVDLKLGFYRSSASEDELEREATGTHSAHDAGWTVVCNDRVVLYRDKTRLTGWGEAGVPSYHAQFNSIAGIIHFKCDEPSKLPLTTTKRGIEAGSEVYLIAKEKMREALKKFTTFTNRFKVDQKFKERLFKEASTRSISVIDDMAQKVKWRTDSRIKGGKTFSPSLPEIEKNDQKRWVKFTKDVDQIRTVSQFLLEKYDADPGVVGEACFDRTHREAIKK
jgi:Histidine kinase-, DNA gyrase B-, and HSP90-like ATPase